MVSRDTTSPLSRIPIIYQFIAIAIAGLLIASLWDGATRWPEDWVIPMKQWITDFFYWLGKKAGIGDYKFRDLTRLIATGLKQPLLWTEYVLYRGYRPLALSPIPWISLVLAAAILGHWIAGWRLALFAALCFIYLSVFGLWRDSMRTLSIVIVAVPIAVMIGLWLGIWVTRSKRAITIIFN